MASGKIVPADPFRLETEGANEPGDQDDRQEQRRSDDVRIARQSRHVID
jgi:hypothetical protein